MIHLNQFQSNQLIKMLGEYYEPLQVKAYFKERWGSDITIQMIQWHKRQHIAEIEKYREDYFEGKEAGADGEIAPKFFSREQLLKELESINEEIKVLTKKAPGNASLRQLLKDRLIVIQTALKSLTSRTTREVQKATEVQKWDLELKDAETLKTRIKGKINKCIEERIQFPSKDSVTAAEMVDLVKSYITTGVEDDDDLHFFIWHCMGYNVPRFAHCKEHNSPFDLVSDCFFDRHNNILLMANRTGGKTRNLSIIGFLDLVFKHGCESNHAGSVRAQADLCKRYIMEYNKKPWLSFLFEDLSHGKIVVNPQNRADIEPSMIEVITASMDGFNSKHPNKCSVDEVELIGWDILQQQISMTQSRDALAGGKGGEAGRIHSRDLYASTRKTSVGTMQRLIDEAEDKGMKIYTWCIFDVLEKCNLDCNAGKKDECPAWKVCKGEAHSCRGFYPIPDFIKKSRNLDDETFESEWMCKKPSSERHIYFDRPFKFTPDHNWIPRFEIPKEWEVRGGMDFGFDNPLAYVKVARSPNGIFYVFFEHKEEGQLLEWHADVITHSPRYQQGELIYADPEAAQERAELANYGIPTLEGVRHIELGINALKRVMRYDTKAESCRLLVFNDLWKLAKEIKYYARDDKMRIPKRSDDHLLDSLRYCIKTWTDSEGFKYDEYQLKQEALADTLRQQRQQREASVPQIVSPLDWDTDMSDWSDQNYF